MLSAGPIFDESKDICGNSRVSTSATGKINRKDFGVVWNVTSRPAVPRVALADDVKLMLDTQFIRKP
ncbi:MAG: YceI family protein [Deltaproteobacteria bacterium]|nr:MAG: YceI family protein [Deltaproteobacteria bacterium]